MSHNVFAYCKNNPINLEDSTGFMPSSWLPEGGGGGWGGPVYYSINKIPFSFRPLESTIGIRKVYTSVKSAVEVGNKIPSQLLRGQNFVIILIVKIQLT